MSGTTITLIILSLVTLALIMMYNALVKHRNLVKEGWSGIDVQLKRRSNLIPNLVEIVKGYMEHEKGLLSEITALRAQAEEESDVEKRSLIESQISRRLGSIFAVAENYPELKASGNFSDLHRSLDSIEDEIQLARRYYNGAVRNFNTMVESFPSNIIASLFHFHSAGYFEIDDAADRAVPEVSFDEEEENHTQKTA